MRPLGKRFRRAVRWGSVVYALAVAGATLLLWRVGEAWWVTTVGLYLPRIVLAAPLPLFLVGLGRLGERGLLGIQLATAVVWLVPLMGLNVPAPALPGSVDPTAPHVRILSYNVNSSVGGVANVVAEVDRYAPDVVLMQEIGDTAALARAMAERFATVKVTDQFLTATRFPVLSETDPEKLTYGGKAHRARFVSVVMQTPLGEVTFFNVHPVSPREDFYRLRGRGLLRELASGHIFSGGAGDAIVANAGLRDLQLESVAGAASRETRPVVIAGDSNLPGLSTVLGRFTGFQDGFAKVGWGFGYTFPVDHHGPWMRIDRVWANDSLRFSAFRVGTSSASDHLCVVADLQRK